MLGSALYDYIIRTLKRSDKSTEVYEAITDTVRDVKHRLPFEEFKYVTYTTGISTLGDYKFALPTDMGHLIGNVKLLGDDYCVLEKITKEEFDRLEPDPESSTVITGVPDKFCVFGNEIYLYPLPDSVSYEYEYNYSTDDTTAITSSTANVGFSTNYREMLKAGVLYRIYRDLGNDQEATKWLAIYENEIKKVVLLEKRLTDAPTVMTPREV